MDRRSIPHVIGWLLVLGAVALVGTAQALPGTNTVDSGDIINGEVMRPDIGRNAVNSAKVANNSLTTADIKDETITAADIGPSAVGFSELGVNSVNSAKVIDGSLTGSDIGGDQRSVAAADARVTAPCCCPSDSNKACRGPQPPRPPLIMPGALSSNRR
jgi:hypothetical protein